LGSGLALASLAQPLTPIIYIRKKLKSLKIFPSHARTRTENIVKFLENFFEKISEDVRKGCQKVISEEEVWKGIPEVNQKR
jgi:hypothetical protein